MPLGTLLLLGAFAGFTIYVGLPLAFLKHLPQSVKIFLNMLATGVLVFLLFDVVSKASDPINAALDQVRTQHTGVGTFVLDVCLLIAGLALGSVGLVYFQRYTFGRVRTSRVTPGIAVADAGSSVQGGAASAPPLFTQGELSSRQLSLLIAIGIGLHNFSEGLAIGQSAAVGALQLAIVLIIGFGLHNMTEGFGIAGPLTGQSASWQFIALLGLIGGGPTFLGTVVGSLFDSPQVFILFLALAAGAIIYVVAELFGVAKRFKAPEIVMWGVLLGFLLGYITDLVVTFGGA